MSGELVNITKKSGLSRRNFLKVVGGGAGAAGLAGCADKAAQTIVPSFKGEETTIPGVAVWYNSTCTECSAGCSIQVRTREGRAVKVEGNKAGPVNRGGVCALGHSSLQAHYDPDRVRQPLVKDASGNFKTATWDEALAKVADGLKSKGKKAIFTGELNGALAGVVSTWKDTFGVSQVTFDVIQPTALVAAAEMVYGAKGLPRFAFDKAEVILNFGADFLETWISPVEFARDWSSTRKTDKPSKLIHIEPRLSLTGANADKWLMNNPGSELDIALFVLKSLIERGRGADLSSDVIANIRRITSDVKVSEVAEISGVESSKILLAVEALANSRSSLVIAGGTGAQTADAIALQTIVALINLVLGNVGKTIDLGTLRSVNTSFKAVENLIASLEKGDTRVVFVLNSNPVYTLPKSYGFHFALKKADLVVAIGTHLDETAQAADVVLPINSSLEGWGDVRAVTGAYGLVQPTMQPLYSTIDAGDVFIRLGKLAGKELFAEPSFQEYLKTSWKNLHSELKLGGDFEQFWLASLERGGYFAPRGEISGAAVINPAVFKLNFKRKIEAEPEGELAVYPYFSVRGFDGRAANRPWLQELPDQVTQIVWDCWVEMNPKTAAALGLSNKDNVTVRAPYGEVNGPLYITEYVAPGIVAIPVGYGHSAYGRYAEGLGSNVYELLPKSTLANGGDGYALVGASAKVMRGVGKSELVRVQEVDSQFGRELARTKVLPAAMAAVAAHGHNEHEEGHEGGHEHGGERPQMYEQRPHPVYKWGMAVDLAACTGCSACVVACYAENNIAVVGKKVVGQGRELSWLRIERYFDGSADELQVSFLPMMCQHCGNAGCEPVCPVYATYHSEEGLNTMVYNRCVGTRYCSNNCSYKVRRFNWFQYEFPETYKWQLNPDITPRNMGVMEKCTFCVHRILEAKDRAKDLGRHVLDGEVQPACVQSCPTQALAFGNLNDPNSKVSKLAANGRAYKVLDEEINTQPAVSYLKEVKCEL